MNINKSYLKVMESLTFPIIVLGTIFHILIEAPFFIGRIRANNWLNKTAFLAEFKDQIDESEEE
jgi:hypothetical protein